MDKNSIQRFELPGHLLQYDFSACMLLCKSPGDGRKLWIKKFDDCGYIIDADEDDKNIYISFGYDDRSGVFVAVDKKNGLTRWSIPGRAFMFRVFSAAVFIIFSDAEGRFFLIKTSSADGSKIWHHQVEDSLHSYTINERTVRLDYYGGGTETLDSRTGTPL